MMRMLPLLVALALTGGAVTGCTGDSHDDHDHGGTATTTKDAEPGTGSGNGDAGHASHEGEEHDLGKITASGIGATVHQIGDLEPGHEAAFEIEIAGDESPAAVRVWVGIETGVGSVKCLAEKESPQAYHAHVEVGASLDPTARVWIEIENSKGERERASLPPHRD